MYEVKEYELGREHFEAGPGYVARETLAVKDGETIQAKSLVKLTDGEAAAYTAEDLTAKTVPYGIAASDAENGSVVVYLSGEFFGEGLVLAEGVTAEDVRPLLRENGIYLKDLLPDTSVKA